MLSREQAQSLTHLLHLLRPAWNEEGIFAALGQVRDRDPFDVSLAALRAAADEKTRTPGVIPSAGPHWHEGEPRVVEKPQWRPPRKDETCKWHAGSFADNCAGCRADELVGDRTLPPNLRKPDASNAIALARAELRQATSQLCGHGTQRIHCTQDHEPHERESEDK